LYRPFFFALVYAGLEDKDQAFTWLEKGYDERYTRFAYLKLEALWDPQRSDQRFSDLVRRDHVANVRNQARMIQLAGGNPDRVIPGHDALQFQKYPTQGRIAKIK
jgi:hypothetical protein